MKIFKSNRSFGNIYATLLKTFFILKMRQQAPLKNLTWRLSSQIDSGAFVKIITFFEKSKILELRNSEILVKLKFPSSVTGEFYCY